MTTLQKAFPSSGATAGARQVVRFAADVILLAAALLATLRGAPSRAAVRPEEFATRQAVVPYAPMASDAITVAAVGDGAGGGPDDMSVSDVIVARQPDLFLYLGNVRKKGTAQEFANYYTPTYGRLRDITNPVVGNHEYGTPDAAGYFTYWNNIPSYYSYDSSGWHFVALNSAQSGELEPGSAQYEWLKNDLDANSLPCTLVYAHHPHYSTDKKGHNDALAPLWSLLAAKGVDVALAGHDHTYQRWKPLDGNGSEQAGGVTAFVVGTGGEEVRDLPAGDARVAAQHATFGALFFDLAPDRLDFRFVNIAGQPLDSGTVACSGAESASQPPSNRISK